MAPPPATITPLLPTTVLPVPLPATGPPPPAPLPAAPPKFGTTPVATVLDPDGCLPWAVPTPPPPPPPFRICGKMILLVESPAVAASTRRAPIRCQDGGNINLPLRSTQPQPGAPMMASPPGQSAFSRIYSLSFYHLTAADWFLNRRGVCLCFRFCSKFFTRFCYRSFWLVAITKFLDFFHRIISFWHLLNMFCL